MDEESLQTLNAVSEELSLLKEELSAARSGGDDGFLRRIADLSSSLDVLSRRLSELEESRISELSSLRADMQSLRSDIDKITFSADSVFSSKIAGIEEKIGSLDKAISGTTASSQLQVSETADVKSELSSLRQAVSSLRDEAKAAAENSYMLAQKLDGLQSSAKSSVAADVAALCMELKGLSSSLTAHTNTISKLSTKLESIDSATQKLPALLESYNSNSAAIRDVESKLSAVLSTLSAQKQELSTESARARQFEELALSLQNELSAFSKELEANAHALESVSASIALLKHSHDAATVEQLEPKFESLSQSIALANDTLSSVASQLSGASSLIKNLDSTSYSLSREASRMQASYSALQEKMSKSADAKQDLSSIEFQLEQLTAEVRQLQKTRPAATNKTPADDTKLVQEISLLRKQIDTLSAQLTEGKGDSATDLSKAIAPVLKELRSISSQINSAQPPDFSPIMQKLEEIKLTQSAVSDEAVVKPALQRTLFEDLQKELKAFEGFDLSDRAKVVVGRLNSLAAKGLVLAGG